MEASKEICMHQPKRYKPADRLVVITKHSNEDKNSCKFDEQPDVEVNK